MIKRLWQLLTLGLVITMLLAACGPAATAVPAKPKVELSVWHSYHTGGSEEQALTQLVAAYQKENPDVTLSVQSIPFDQIFNKWKTDAASGGAAADMFTAPNDDLGNWVRAGLVEPLDSQLTGKLGGYAQAGIDGLTVEGKIYGVPGIIKAVALYYNKSTVATAPKTTDELLALVKSGKKLGIIVGGGAPYFNFGWYSAFGGKLMDSTGKCVADTTGVVDAMQYLVDLKAAGMTYDTDGGKLATAFRQGQLDMIVDGPWMLGDYKKDLGDNLGVVAMPAGPKGPSQPLSGIDGWYINPNSKNKEAAVAFGLYIFSAAGLKIYADVAGDPPVRTDVTVSDPLIKTFADAAAAGFPRPQSKEFGNYWGPFGDMFTKVLEGKSTPADGVTEACAAMNKANSK